MKRLLLVVIVLVAAQANGWTLAADRRIAAAGAKLSPPDLLLVIKKFNKDFARGIAKANAGEPRDAHTADLRSRIEMETKTAIAMLKANQSMSDVVAELGVIAHLVADANNPFHVVGDKPSQHADFERYFESRMTKFPLVDYGRENRLRLADFLDRTVKRTAKLAPLVDEEYARGNSSTFDDHSTAFGVASLCYSHAVTDTANLFTYIWKESGGYVAGH